MRNINQVPNYYESDYSNFTGLLGGMKVLSLNTNDVIIGLIFKEQFYSVMNLDYHTAYFEQDVNST